MDVSIVSDVFIKLTAAMVLGGVLGVERTIVGKYAGLRTYSLVSMGSALFVALSIIVNTQYAGLNFDPTRVAAQVVTGVGFLGAGLIFFQENKLQGLTTAAGLWVAAGVGMACGFGLYLIALSASLLTLLVFQAMWRVEIGIKKISNGNEPTTYRSTDDKTV